MLRNYSPSVYLLFQYIWKEKSINMKRAVQVLVGVN